MTFPQLRESSSHAAVMMIAQLQLPNMGDNYMGLEKTGSYVFVLHNAYELLKTPN